MFIGVAQEKAQAFNGKKINGQFQFDRDKTVYVNHYYFYIDDEEFGPLFLKICSQPPRGAGGDERPPERRSAKNLGIALKRAYVNRSELSAVPIRAFLLADVFTDLLQFKSDCGNSIPTGPEVLAREIPFLAA